MVGKKRKEKKNRKKNVVCGWWGKKERGEWEQRERGEKKMRKESILGIVKKYIYILKNRIVKLK